MSVHTLHLIIVFCLVVAVFTAFLPAISSLSKAQSPA